MEQHKSEYQSVHPDRVEEKELITTLRSHIDKLPELESRLLTFCYVANMSHEKVAQSLGIPRRTVTDKIQRALAQLRDSLTKAGVAAVVPLISAPNLYEAMSSGYECPRGMTERILSRIQSARLERVRAQSRRAIAPKTRESALAGFGLAIALVAIVGALWYAAGNSAKVPAQSAIPASAGKTAESEMPKPVADEIVYEDHFENKDLAPFWVKANPPGQVHSQCGSNLPILMLATGGPGVKMNRQTMSPDVEIISRSVELRDRPIEVVFGESPSVGFAKADPDGLHFELEIDGKRSDISVDFSGAPSGNPTRVSVIEILDEMGARLVTERHTEDSQGNSSHLVYLGEDTQPIDDSPDYFFGRILIGPEGAIALGSKADNDHYLKIGGIPRRIKSVAVRWSASTKAENMFSAQLLKSMFVKRLAAWPNARMKSTPVP